MITQEDLYLSVNDLLSEKKVKVRDLLYLKDGELHKGYSAVIGKTIVLQLDKDKYPYSDKEPCAKAACEMLLSFKDSYEIRNNLGAYTRDPDDLDTYCVTFEAYTDRVPAIPDITIYVKEDNKEAAIKKATVQIFERMKAGTLPSYPFGVKDVYPNDYWNDCPASLE